MELRIFVFSRPSERSLDACAAQLLVMLRELRELSPAHSFSVDSSGEVLDSRSACADALTAGLHVGNAGGHGVVRAYDVALVARPSAGVVSRMRVVMGLGVDLTPMWRGNRVELTMHSSAVPDPGLALDSLVAMATATEADWGFAGGEAVPYLPPLGPGTPAVGWLTFLSRRHSVPSSLGAPARVIQLGPQGVVIAAQPAAVSEGSVDDLANVQAVRDALGTAVLQRPPLPTAVTPQVTPRPSP